MIPNDKNQTNNTYSTKYNIYIQMCYCKTCCTKYCTLKYVEHKKLPGGSQIRRLNFNHPPMWVYSADWRRNEPHIVAAVGWRLVRKEAFQLLLECPAIVDTVKWED